MDVDSVAVPDEAGLTDVYWEAEAVRLCFEEGVGSGEALGEPERPRVEEAHPEAGRVALTEAVVDRESVKMEGGDST